MAELNEKTVNEEIQYLGGMLTATHEEDKKRLNSIGARLIELSGVNCSPEYSKSAVNRHLDLLGLKVRDKITGFEGIVSSVSFDLYGCIQTVVSPAVDKDMKKENDRWFDTTRLEILENSPVMSLPNFDHGYVAEGKKGPADKPER